jgi:ketosteroid isomerase-like protein
LSTLDSCSAKPNNNLQPITPHSAVSRYHFSPDRPSAEVNVMHFKRQRYHITHTLAQDDAVAVEAVWTGTLAVAMGSLAEGAEMKAHFAMFFVMANGKIQVQRNYDCFSPW